jgi:hypothetical protein
MAGRKIRDEQDARRCMEAAAALVHRRRLGTTARSFASHRRLGPRELSVRQANRILTLGCLQA